MMVMAILRQRWLGLCYVVELMATLHTKIVTTTAIVSIDYNRQIVHTKNRAYILGAPDIAYELEFPGAYNRMFTPESGTCK